MSSNVARIKPTLATAHNRATLWPQCLSGAAHWWRGIRIYVFFFVPKHLQNFEYVLSVVCCCRSQAKGFCRVNHNFLHGPTILNSKGMIVATLVSFWFAIAQSHNIFFFAILGTPSFLVLSIEAPVYLIFWRWNFRNIYSPGIWSRSGALPSGASFVPLFRFFFASSHSKGDNLLFSLILSYLFRLLLINSNPAPPPKEPTLTTSK